jgi:hypothetical protein
VQRTPPYRQAPFERSRRPRRRPFFGGLGYASVGPFFGNIGGLESMLASPTGLGLSYAASNTGFLLGGGGGAVLWGHLWVGGKGYSLVNGGFQNSLGSVSVGASGGAFELGYALGGERMLVVPFFGVGGLNRSMSVENDSEQDMLDITRSLAPDADGRRVIAPPGGSREFNAPVGTLEAGIRVQRLLFSRSGGFSAGFELGFLGSIIEPPWETDGYEVTNAEGASLEGVYIRLNIGGGGFLFR